MTEKYKTADEAIEAAKAAMGEMDLIEFEGQNCNDYNDEANCEGWDGFDNRCECGNRRVYWSTYSDADGNHHAFACAN